MIDNVEWAGSYWVDIVDDWDAFYENYEYYENYYYHTPINFYIVAYDYAGNRSRRSETVTFQFCWGCGDCASYLSAPAPKAGIPFTGTAIVQSNRCILSAAPTAVPPKKKLELSPELY